MASTRIWRGTTSTTSPCRAFSSMLGRAHEKPYPHRATSWATSRVVGSSAFLGIVMALLHRARNSGLGQVVEANMVDGSSHLASMPRLATKFPVWGRPTRHEPAGRRMPLLRHLRDEGRQIHGRWRAGAAVLRRFAQRSWAQGERFRRQPHGSARPGAKQAEIFTANVQVEGLAR